MREQLQAQGAIVSIVEIEALWRRYLKSYADPQIRGKLQRRWRDDPNVVRGRIQFEYPPTFQPGYIGPALMANDTRILFIWQNPGQGGEPAAEHDKILARKLKAFARSQISLAELSAFQADHIVKWWPLYRDKGIFAETEGDRASLQDAARRQRRRDIDLLPKAKRPSVKCVALLNVFPLKTIGNHPPLGRLSGYGEGSTLLKRHMWECLVKPTIEAIAPTIIVHHPGTKPYLPQLEQLASKPRLVCVLHPGDRNLRARCDELKKS